MTFNTRWLDAATWVVAWILLLPLLYHLVAILVDFVTDVWTFGL